MNEKEIKKEYWKHIRKDAEEILAKTNSYTSTEEIVKLMHEASAKHYPEWMYTAKYMYETDLSIEIAVVRLIKEMTPNE